MSRDELFRGTVYLCSHHWIGCYLCGNEHFDHKGIQTEVRSMKVEVTLCKGVHTSKDAAYKFEDANKTPLTRN